MTTQRELAAASENSLAAFLSSVLPDSTEDTVPSMQEQENGSNQASGSSVFSSHLDSNTNVSTNHNNSELFIELKVLYTVARKQTRYS